MRLEDAITRGITGSRRSGGASLTGMLADISRLSGPGATNLSRYLGLPRRTVANWLLGTSATTSPERMELLRRAQRRALVRGRDPEPLRTGAVGWQGKLRISSDTRERKIVTTEWDGARPDIDMWLAGRDADCAEDFEAQIDAGLTGSTRARRAELLRTDAVRFFRSRGDALRWSRS